MRYFLIEFSTYLDGELYSKGIDTKIGEKFPNLKEIEKSIPRQLNIEGLIACVSIPVELTKEDFESFTS